MNSSTNPLGHQITFDNIATFFNVQHLNGGTGFPMANSEVSNLQWRVDHSPLTLITVKQAQMRFLTNINFRFHERIYL
jgi:hypothetical protein